MAFGHFETLFDSRVIQGYGVGPDFSQVRGWKDNVNDSQAQYEATCHAAATTK